MNKVEYEVCYRCGGYPEYDEQGLPHTCYICANTGLITKAEHDAYVREMEQA